jgi:hypothetical protein
MGVAYLFGVLLAQTGDPSNRSEMVPERASRQVFRVLSQAEIAILALQLSRELRNTDNLISECEDRGVFLVRRW